ncbi:hypothetical protein LTR84_005582 [Exophiala bonariae]|uniref:Transcription factor domain-containing protein n=1 Tax=Exophiala bonariae TaxID=1690606 RepID=A0AAV9N685_9EURO|nr:hypothetical protein LTR84_005582 [Exophiala bonariae]
MRCAKAKRDCVVPDSHRGSPALSQESQPNDNETSSYGGLSQLGNPENMPEVVPHTTETPSLAQQLVTGAPNNLQPRINMGGTAKSSGHVKISNLPSVYMTSPLGTIDAQLLASSTSEVPSQLGLSNQTSSEPNFAPPPYEMRVNDLLSLLQYFRAKIVQNVLFMAPSDLDDLPSLIQGRPELAYSIAFTTAWFVPGYGPMRASLTPHVLKIVRANHYSMRRTDDDMWTLLQALGVLYLYASPIDSEEPEGSTPHYPELSFRFLKPLVESLAIYASIHRSYEDLTKGVDLVTPSGNFCPALRRYLFWLWLFTSSQQYSLITRTPPTISEDSIIKSAPNLLSAIQDDAFIRKILAQVELYLLWAKSGIKYPNLREWWSSPQAELDIASTKEMLTEFDKILLDWRQKWSLEDNATAPGMNADRFNNTTVESLFRYARFHISTYATRTLYKAMTESTEADPSTSRLVALSPQLTELFSRSVDAAVSWTRFFIDLDPVAIETARYVPAINFTKITFSCVFLIMAAEVLAGPDLNLDRHLQSVRDAASCMRELGVDENAPPRVYANRILRRLQATDTSRLLDAIRIVPHPSSQERQANVCANALSSVDSQDNHRSYGSGSTMPGSSGQTLNPDATTEPDFPFFDFNVFLENDEDDIFNFDKTWGGKSLEEIAALFGDEMAVENLNDVDPNAKVLATTKHVEIESSHDKSKV